MQINELAHDCYLITGRQKEAAGGRCFSVDVIQPKPDCCPYCGSSNIVGHGNAKVLIKDVPQSGKHVTLRVNARRFRCRSAQCLKSFNESLPGIHEHRHMTNRLIGWIVNQALHHSFNSIAGAIGVTEGTIRQIIKSHVKYLDQHVAFDVPQRLGLQTIQLLKQQRLAAYNIDTQALVGLLLSLEHASLTEYLSSLYRKHTVAYVAIDMQPLVRAAVAAAMPDARVVIDIAYLSRLGLEAVEQVLSTVRGTLRPGNERRVLAGCYGTLAKRAHELSPDEVSKIASWGARFPLLEQAYRLKEEYCDLLSSNSRSEAGRRYQLWLSRIPADLAPHFAAIIEAWDTWREEILDYFVDRVSNPGPAVLTQLSAALEHAIRRHSFEILRIRLLFGEAASQIMANQDGTPNYSRQVDTGKSGGPKQNQMQTGGVNLADILDQAHSAIH